MARMFGSSKWFRIRRLLLLAATGFLVYTIIFLGGWQPVDNVATRVFSESTTEAVKPLPAHGMHVIDDLAARDLTIDIPVKSASFASAPVTAGDARPNLTRSDRSQFPATTDLTLPGTMPPSQSDQLVAKVLANTANIANAQRNEELLAAYSRGGRFFRTTGSVLTTSSFC